jgi:hypothetical protein
MKQAFLLRLHIDKAVMPYLYFIIGVSNFFIDENLIS